LALVAKFAQAGLFDLSQATDLLTDAQSALGLSMKDPIKHAANMARVADVLVKANTIANASVEQFSESLTTKAAASLRRVNKDVVEGVAVLAAYADQGIKGAEAGTALSIIMRDLTTKAIKNAAAFRRYNVQVFNSSGKMANLIDIVSDLEKALAGMSDQQAKATLLQMGFADRSVVFLSSLIGMSENMRRYEDALKRAGGTMERVAGKQLTPFQKGWAMLAGAFTEMTQAFKPFVDSFGRGMAVISKHLPDLNRWFHVLQLGAVQLNVVFLDMLNNFLRGLATLNRFAIKATDVVAGLISGGRLRRPSPAPGKGTFEPAIAANEQRMTQLVAQMQGFAARGPYNPATGGFGTPASAPSPAFVGPTRPAAGITEATGSQILRELQAINNNTREGIGLAD
jgi:TP901 family phage tail tape measure protein